MLRNLTVAAVSLLSLTAFADEPQAALTEIKSSFGLVPAAFRVAPDELTSPVWNELKALEMNPSTSLNGKQKELIGLSVAAQIPCQYCTYMHTEFAKLNGASQRDLREAIGVAAIVRHWTTFVDGQADEAMPKQEKLSPEIEATYADVQQTMGAVPPFIKRFPLSSVSAAWKAYKVALAGSEGSTLSKKDRALIALAVSASVPSESCVKSYTMMAKLNGATEQEIGEAIAMASLTRAGSTILNGNLVDPASFRAEVDTLVKNAKKAMKKETASR